MWSRFDGNVPSRLYTRFLIISNLWPWPLTLKILSPLCLAIWNNLMKFGQDPIENVPSRLHTNILSDLDLWPRKSIGLFVLPFVTIEWSEVKIWLWMCPLVCIQGFWSYPICDLDLWHWKSLGLLSCHM